MSEQWCYLTASFGCCEVYKSYSNHQLWEASEHPKTFKFLLDLKWWCYCCCVSCYLIQLPDNMTSFPFQSAFIFDIFYATFTSLSYVLSVYPFLLLALPSPGHLLLSLLLRFLFPFFCLLLLLLFSKFFIFSLFPHPPLFYLVFFCAASFFLLSFLLTLLSPSFLSHASSHISWFLRNCWGRTQL